MLINEIKNADFRDEKAIFYFFYKKEKRKNEQRNVDNTGQIIHKFSILIQRNCIVFVKKLIDTKYFSEVLSMLRHTKIQRIVFFITSI